MTRTKCSPHRLPTQGVPRWNLQRVLLPTAKTGRISNQNRRKDLPIHEKVPMYYKATSPRFQRYRNLPPNNGQVARIQIMSRSRLHLENARRVISNLPISQVRPFKALRGPSAVTKFRAGLTLTLSIFDLALSRNDLVRGDCCGFLLSRTRSNSVK